MIAADAIVRRALDVRVRRVNDTQLVARGPDIVELNDVAAAIWRLADGARSVRAISHDLAEEYDVTEEDALADVQEFLAEMVAAGFMRLAPEPPRS